MNVDWTKLVVAVAGIGACVALAIGDTVSTTAAFGLMGTIVGYVLGNGKSVAQGNIPGEMLSPTHPNPE